MGNFIYRRDVCQLGAHTLVMEWKDVRSVRMRYSERTRAFHISAPVNFPEERIRKFAADNIAWMDSVAEKLKDKEAREDALDEETVQRFCERAAQMLNEQQKIMGLQTQRLNFKYMTSRWGSAIPAKRTITLNYRLALYPEECTLYVVTHELAHFRYHGHTAEFWREVEKYFPDWRRVRAMLR